MGRYNRYYRPRRVGSGFSVFIIVVILAVGTGYAGTKYIVYPYLLDGNPQAETEVGTGSGTDSATDSGIDVIPSMPSIIIDQQDITDVNTTTDGGVAVDEVPTAAPEGIIAEKGPFSVQFGSFSTKAGAEELSAQLTQKGIYSYVYESGGNHKVLGLPYTDKEKANQAASIVSAAVSDAFVVDLATIMN